MNFDIYGIDEMKTIDDSKRTIEKGFASILYFDGPALKEVDYIADYLIDNFNRYCG